MLWDHLELNTEGVLQSERRPLIGLTRPGHIDSGRSRTFLEVGLLVQLAVITSIEHVFIVLLRTELSQRTYQTKCAGTVVFFAYLAYVGLVHFGETVVTVVALKRVAETIVAFAWNAVPFVLQHSNAMAKHHDLLVTAFQLDFRC